MTNYYTHVPCEAMMLNGADMTAVKMDVYSRANLNIKPSTHAIIITKIDSVESFTQIPEIENGLVSTHMCYAFYIKIIDKKTGEEVSLPSNWNHINMKREITGERQISIAQNEE